jgi:23S rRNA pseudouridine1911/1915/1917 synthase
MKGTEHTFSVDSEEHGTRLDQFLAGHISDLSRARAHALIRAGSATVDGQAAKPSHKVREGESIRIVVVPPDLPSYEAEDIPLDIVFEDGHLIVINKPAGMVVHPAAGVTSGTLVNALLAHSRELPKTGGEDRPGIVHRLDKKTSGLLVVAKTEVSLRKLSDSIGRREIKRQYRALTYGSLAESEGTIDAPIGRSPSDRKKMAVGGLGNREALTHFTVRESLADITHLSVRLSTGRTHQIRVHLAYIGHPIIGDPVYGARLKRFHDTMPRPVVDAIAGLEGHMLHSEILEFEHPATEESVRFEASPPEEFENLLRLLREESGL